MKTFGNAVPPGASADGLMDRDRTAAPATSLFPPPELLRLAEQVLTACQQRATEAGYRTERWRADVAPPDWDWDWNVTGYHVLRVQVSFHCPCGRVQSLVTLQHISDVMLRQARHAALFVAESVADTILYEFKKHVDGEQH